ncbi:hypothetical protein [Roseomonas sp. USHLN139]|uniref:hypothetical protein n=1 Tax=Roseomonas sp. USHLN139 TaxID=3081298 RepID=UPI003B01D865
MSQHPLIQRAEEAGVSLFLEGGRVRWRASQPPHPDLLVALRADLTAISAELAVTEREAEAANAEAELTLFPAATAAAPVLLPPLPFRSPRIWEPQSLEARAVSYVNEPGAEIVSGSQGWLYVTLLDGRFLYLEHNPIILVHILRR